MKILKLHAENVKRLKAVEIEPDKDGNLVLIAGKNNQGKSSVLDSIAWALGGARDITSRPIRDGEASAEIVLDLGDQEPRIRVTRTWTANDKSYLKVESAEGAKYSSPQKMLDDLIGRLSFDPLEFARLGAKDRMGVLRSVADIPIDLDEIDRKRQEVYEQRRELGRELKRLEGALASTPEPPDGTPAQEVSASDVAEELTAAIEHNNAVRNHAARYNQVASQCSDLEAEIAKLQARLKELQAERDRMAADPIAFVNEDEIRYKLQGIEKTNANVRVAQAHIAATKAVSDARSAHDLADAEVKRLDQQKQDALSLATFPLPGLGLDDGDVTLDGIPFEQLSSSAQLQASLAMAMAMNPKLRVIRITDGSLLDSDSMAQIAEMAKANDCQVWVEVVDESGSVGVVIEDGQVKGGEPAAVRMAAGSSPEA